MSTCRERCDWKKYAAAPEERVPRALGEDDWNGNEDGRPKESRMPRIQKKRKEYRPSGFRVGMMTREPGSHEWSGLKVRRTSVYPIAVVES